MKAEQQEIARRVEGLFALADQLEARLAKPIPLQPGEATKGREWWASRFAKRIQLESTVPVCFERSPVGRSQFNLAFGISKEIIRRQTNQN